MKRSTPHEGAAGRAAERADGRAKARRAALNALRRARRAADRAGVDLTEWEGEFLGSVEARVGAFGRAFGDPEKGAPGAALSLRQGVKLKEISAKARGAKSSGEAPKKRGFAARKASRRRTRVDEA